MINKRDLNESIAELEGARNHTPQMCQQLASLYIIREKLFDQSETPDYGYSMASAPMESTFPKPDSMDEMQPRNGASAMSGRTTSSGYGSGSEYMPMTKQMAMEWTQSMENEDGTKGPHWSMEQAKTVMAQKGIECDPLEFWVALNAMYSDYMPVAKKLGVNNMDFYTQMAKAFLDDKDALPDKLARYYEYIVK